MAGKRDKPEEIVLKLRQVEVLQGQGSSIADAVRQIGVTQPNYYRWRKEYGGMTRDQLKRLRVTDIVDKQTSSRMMAGIKGRDTKPELVLRRALHARGFRYRLHSKNVPGRPDLVFPKHHAIVFVHGCFWHRHERCRYTTTPSTRPEFWQAKLDANVARDGAVQGQLLEAGWRVATVWECSLRKTDQLAATVELLAAWLRSNGRQLEVGEMDIKHSE